MHYVDITDKRYKNKTKIATLSRNINICLIALIIVLITVAAVFVLKSINNNVSSDIARSYSIETAEKFNSYISRDIVLVQKAALSRAITEWFADEEKYDKRANAYYEMMDYAGLLKSASLYFGIQKSLNEYSINGEAALSYFSPFDWLDPSIEYNNWYFDCIASENKYTLNIDIDKITDEWTLWINHKVIKNKEVLGVFCSGLPFREILHEIFNKFDNINIKGYIIDKKGNIKMDSSFSDVSGKENITDIGHDPFFISEIDFYLKSIDSHFDRQAPPKVIKLSQKTFRYASVAPIAGSDWSVVVFINHNLFSNFSDSMEILPLPIALLLALFLYVVGHNILIKWLIFNPLNRLTKSVSEADADEALIFGSERADEIGELSRTIRNASFEQRRLRNLLYAGSNATSVLLAIEDGKDIKMSFLKGMELIGRSLDVDRVQLWRNENINGSLHFVHAYQWLSEVGRSCPPVHIGLKFPYSEKPEWEKMFLRGEYINSPFSGLSKDDQEFLQTYAIKTILIIPLFLQGRFWGLFSIDDCKQERIFTEDEVKILSSVSLMMTNALLHNDMMQDVLASASKLDAVISNYTGIIWSVDKDEVITLFNGLYLEKIGVTPALLIGKKLDYVKQKGWYPDVIEKIKETFEKGPREWISEKKFLARTTPIFDKNGEVSAVVGSIDDLTEMIELQEKLETALEEAKEASFAKGNFLANMSHEIRTPMNAIIGMTQIAAKTDDVEKLKYCLSNIENSSTHLLGIINDILDMSKIEAGKFNLDHSSLNIEKMLIRVSNLIIEKVEKKKIKFNIVLGAGMSMHYIGDELRLSQVVTNLLSNAVKFTPEGGKIEVTADEIKKEPDYSILLFAVKDTGIGMTKEQMSRLFTAFEQAESGTARKFGGTGLGLSISKSIVENMGGRIWAESKPNEGSKFIFEVKLERPDQQREAIIYDNISPSDIKLLIVDPDTNEREYFKSILKSFGIINIHEADNPEQAINLAVTARNMQKPYDIVFADYNFEYEKGVDFIKKAEIGLDRNNVVLMTTFLNWNRIESLAHSIGINRFIPKPLFPSAILNAINEVIGGAVKNLGITSEMRVEMPDFSNITLLLAEDVEVNREIFLTLFEDTQAKIDIAENGLVAVEKFKQNPDSYDIIIMDIQMPVMDGLEATRAIRSLGTERAKSIPIIAMTANVFKEDIDNCIAAGMNDHVGKPLVIEEINAAVIKYLKKS